jgi:hypothetical protein
VPSRDGLPKTPAGRLALPDLIGMEDVRRTVQDISPEDRIEWDQHSSQSIFIKRAKKRARSSSPMSSPAGNASAYLSSKAEYSNTTVDPGSELWGRYSLNGSNAATPQGPAIPALANIMYTSSPQTSKIGTTPRSVGGLRRTTSCGSQFPKRRRVGGIEGDDVFTESANIGPSKLSVLIERVQEGLSQSKPLPMQKKTLHPSIAEKISSHDCERQPIKTLQLSMDAPDPHAGAIGLRRLDNTTGGDSNGSDYGDFDDEDLNDTSMFDALVVKPQVSAAPISSIAKSKTLPDPPLQKVIPSARAQRLLPSPKKVWKESELGKSEAENDEFDDSDEELYAAGLDDMVAKFASQTQVCNPISTSRVPSSSGMPQKGSGLKTESDDEFGDDGLDDLENAEFEVVEAAATQSQHIHHSLQPVCTWIP